MPNSKNFVSLALPVLFGMYFCCFRRCCCCCCFLTSSRRALRLRSQQRTGRIPASHEEPRVCVGVGGSVWERESTFFLIKIHAYTRESERYWVVCVSVCVCVCSLSLSLSLAPSLVLEPLLLRERMPFAGFSCCCFCCRLICCSCRSQLL